MSCRLIAAAAVLGWSQVVRFEPAIYELLLHESIKYLLHQMKDLKDVLVAREHALQAVNPQARPRGSTEASTSPAAPISSSAVASAASIASNTFSAAATSASLFAARFRNSEVSTEESETQQKHARLLSDLITGALMSEEIERFRCVGWIF